MSVTCGTPPGAFDLQQYAGAASTVAGVLGAAMVAAIALRLGAPPCDTVEASPPQAPAGDHPAAGRTAAPRPLLTMPVALVSTLLASYGFAVVAGNPQCDTASLSTFFAGSQFGLGATAAFFAITWLLVDYRVEGQAVFNAAFMTALVASISVGYVVVAAWEVKAAQRMPLGRSDWAMLVTAAGALPTLAILGWIIRGGRRRGSLGVAALRWSMLVAMTLVIALSAASGFVGLGDLSRSFNVVSAFCAADSLVFSAFVLLLPTRGGKRDADARSAAALARRGWALLFRR